MPDVLSIRETVQRAKAEGLPISEYTLRRLIRSGEIPIRRVGQTILLYYPNLIRYLTCADGADNTPTTVVGHVCIRRVAM